MLSGIGASAMQHSTVVAKHRARRHFGVGNLIGFRLTLFFPAVRADHDLRGTVLSRKGGERPDGAEQWFDLPWHIAAPDTAVPMEYLSRFARRNRHCRSEVQLHVVTVLCQIRSCSIQHAGIQRQFTTGSRARNQCADALGFKTGERVTAVDGFLQKRSQILL